MNKAIQEMTLEELFALWTTAYQFYGVNPTEDLEQVLDNCWNEFLARKAGN